MANIRKKEKLFDVLLEITSLMPWWCSVLLAVLTYLLLHWYAGTPVPPLTLGRTASYLIATLPRAVAGVFQYVLPIIFLAGAVISVLAANRRKELHGQVAKSGQRSALEEVSWQEFELLVGEYFRRKGFVVQEIGGGGADGGVDLIAVLGKDRYLVQCKQWKSKQVGVAVVRELFGVMNAQGAAGAFVVASGGFTSEAKQFAEGREIKIIAGDRIVAEISSQSDTGRASVVKPDSASASPTPVCPKCGSGMTKRVARQGANAGKAFWGCVTYPVCRGTRAG
jgi:restriction system protein